MALEIERPEEDDRPMTTGEGSAGAAVSETHLSVVIRVGDRAYKLKKPVRFPFVDQSTREQRSDLCRREVERNRRLAPDVYLGVADVTGPDGELCDHLVVMRRMPDDRRLSTLAGATDPRVIPGLRQLAELLAEFHGRAQRSAEIDAAATAEKLRERWRSNASEMRDLEGTVFAEGAVDDTLDQAERYLEGRERLLADRVAGGFVCDGHGDLLATDIFLLDDGPRVLDCLDFDERLAYGDVASDIAFLAMDLERLGHRDLADLWVTDYEQASGAPIPGSLLHHYIAYRAQVRAKVAALRSAQRDDPTDATDARQLLVLCAAHLRAATPRLVIVGGAPGTGKTTVARALGDERGWRVVRSDVERKASTTEGPDTSETWRRGRYSPAQTAAVYRRLMDAARDELELGRSVIVDATFSTAVERAAARRLADDVHADLLELRCTLDPAERDRRIRERRARGDDASDADPQIAARLAAAADPWPEATEISTAASVTSVGQRAIGLVDHWVAG
jgi:aminoglycoside phosphotransferase family enzyme/predicted kinase